MLEVRRQALGARVRRAAAAGQRPRSTLAGAPRRVGAHVRRMPERAAYAIFDRAADLTVARGGADRLRANYAQGAP